MKINLIFVTVQILGALVFFLNIIGNTKLSTKKVYLYNGDGSVEKNGYIFYPLDVIVYLLYNTVY